MGFKFYPLIDNPVLVTVIEVRVGSVSNPLAWLTDLNLNNVFFLIFISFIM